MDSFEDALRAAAALMDVDGVVGVGEGETPDGDRAIVVMVTSQSEVPDLPSSYHGVPVELVETGTIEAEDQGRTS